MEELVARHPFGASFNEFILTLHSLQAYMLVRDMIELCLLFFFVSRTNICHHFPIAASLLKAFIWPSHWLLEQSETLSLLRIESWTMLLCSNAIMHVLISFLLYVYTFMLPAIHGFIWWLFNNIKLWKCYIKLLFTKRSETQQ